jgi:protein-L-isoaspartate(D-aspartate) O-methyltransferase
MDSAALAYNSAAARQAMVNSQLRTNTITDSALLAAYSTLERGAYTPAAACYVDENIPLSLGRCLLAPMLGAKLLQAVAPLAGKKILLVAGGTGYLAAIATAAGGVVTLLEKPDMASKALKMSPLFTVVAGENAAAAASHGPFDAVVVDGGAIGCMPDSLLALLAPGGNLLAVWRPDADAPGVVCRFQLIAGVTSRVPLCDAFAPLLPEFTPNAEFRL